MNTENIGQGTKYDQDKLRWDLAPWDAIEGGIKVITFGAKKYKDRNWEIGISYGRVFGALMRHISDWFFAKMTGKNGLDPETGLSHLDHAQCCIWFLSAYEKRLMFQFDDRPVFGGQKTLGTKMSREDALFLAQSGLKIHVDDLEGIQRDPNETIR